MANSAALKLKAQARLRLQQQQAAAQPASAEQPAQPAQPSIMDRVGGVADAVGGAAYQTGVGVNRGILNVLGLPGDLADIVPDFVPVFGQLKSVLPGGRELQDAFRLDNQHVPAPRNFGETLASRIGEEVGSAAVPVGGAAAKAAQMGTQAIRKAGGWTRYLLEPAAVDPVKYIAKETGVATAAGTGAGVANAMVPRDTTAGQYADMAGAMTGAGALALTDTVGRSLANILSAIFQRDAYVDQTVKDAVVDRLGKAGGIDTGTGPMDTQTLVDAINSPAAQRPGTVIPGFKESLADRTGNPGIAAMEYGRQSGPNAGQFAVRRSANNEVVDAAMRGVEPQQTPGAFRSALEDTRDQRVAQSMSEAQAAQAEFDRYIQSLSPTMSGEDRGMAVRGGVENANRAARETEHMAWEGTDAQVDPAPLAQRMDETRQSLPLARQDAVSGLDRTIDIPARLQEAGGGPVSVQELNSMRTTLQYAQRQALASGDRNQAETAGQFIEEINGYLGSEAVPAAVREQTAAARQVSRDVNERFNRPGDPLQQTLATREGGRSALPDSRVAPLFVQPDSKQASNIDRLLAETDLSSQGANVRAAIKDEILGQLESAKALGNSEATDNFLRSYNRVFDRYPDLREEIQAASMAGDNAAAAQRATSELTASVGSPDGTVKGKGPVGKYLSYTDATSERAISEVLNAKDPAGAADELMNFVGDSPKAAEGARAAFWQKLRSESTSSDNAQRSAGGKYQWRGDWLKRFLDQPNVTAVAERLYRGNEAALEKIRQYADVLDNVDLRQRGRAPGTSGTAQGVNPVLTPETLQSRFYAYMRGQVSGTYLATSIAAVLARRFVRNAQTDAIERMTDEVLLNPDLAAALLKENNPANRAALARKAKGWLGNEASTVLNMLDGEDQQDGNTPVEITVRGTDPEKN